jgi:hypothetical protein
MLGSHARWSPPISKPTARASTAFHWKISMPTSLPKLAAMLSGAALAETVRTVLGASVAATSAARKNVLYILADDMRADWGTYGLPVRTPNLDKLAAESIKFEHAFSQISVCSPSRQSFMTCVAMPCSRTHERRRTGPADTQSHCSHPACAWRGSPASSLRFLVRLRLVALRTYMNRGTSGTCGPRCGLDGMGWSEQRLAARHPRCVELHRCQPAFGAGHARALPGRGRVRATSSFPQQFTANNKTTTTKQQQQQQKQQKQQQGAVQQPCQK